MNEPRYCDTCAAYTYNDDHVCVTYDGPPCVTCGEPTTCASYGAPGVGTFVVCRNDHRVGDEPRILRLDETI
jgi:hypothetical protein